MKILLVDADSIIPNLALMKLSTWHKNNGDSVELIKLNLPYFPNRKKKSFFLHRGLSPLVFDKIYCSVVFDGNKEFVKGKDVIFGGTGVDLTTVLPDDVENCEPDYSLYPDNDTSYGFITRGCIRKCPFCKVPEKEGYIHKVNEVDSIVRHKKVKFLDNNILAYPLHKEVLRELISKNIKCQFTQGLDIRLTDHENSLLLSKLKYIKEYTFAFDDWKYKSIIDKKLSLLSWRKPFQFRFFVYIHPNMSLFETVQRIKYLKERDCLPYVMRDVSCWGSKYSDFFMDVAAYCNQVHVFKKMDFLEFLKKRYTKVDRITNNYKLWNDNL
jgi:hypothetical protein